jgi:hypothetical protein
MLMDVKLHTEAGIVKLMTEYKYRANWEKHHNISHTQRTASPKP